MNIVVKDRGYGTLSGYYVEGSIEMEGEFVWHDREDGSPCQQYYSGSWIRFQHDKMHCLTGASDYDANNNEYGFYVSDKDVTLDTEEWLEETGIDHLNMSPEEQVLLTIFLTGFMK